MTTRFDIRLGLIVVDVRIWGPSGSSVIPMALDTGASMSMINVARLLYVGYKTTSAVGRSIVTTASGSEQAVLFDVSSIEALGARRDRFRVLAYNLPPATGVMGLLGLDFFRNRRLVIDFRKATVQLK